MQSIVGVLSPGSGSKRKAGIQSPLGTPKRARHTPPTAAAPHNVSEAVLVASSPSFVICTHLQPYPFGVPLEQPVAGDCGWSSLSILIYGHAGLFRSIRNRAADAVSDNWDTVSAYFAVEEDAAQFQQAFTQTVRQDALLDDRTLYLCSIALSINIRVVTRESKNTVRCQVYRGAPVEDATHAEDGMVPAYTIFFEGAHYEPFPMWIRTPQNIRPIYPPSLATMPRDLPADPIIARNPANGYFLVDGSQVAAQHRLQSYLAEFQAQGTDTNAEDLALAKTARSAVESMKKEETKTDHAKSVSDVFKRLLPGLSPYRPTAVHASDEMILPSATRRFFIRCKDKDDALDKRADVVQLLRACPASSRILLCPGMKPIAIRFIVSNNNMDAWQFNRVDRHSGSRSWGCNAEVADVAAQAPLSIYVSFPYSSKTSNPFLATQLDLQDTQLADFATGLFAFSAHTGASSDDLACALANAVTSGASSNKSLQSRFQQAVNADTTLLGHLASRAQKCPDRSVRNDLLQPRSRGSDATILAVLLKGEAEHCPGIIQAPTGRLAAIVDELVCSRGPWMLLPWQIEIQEEPDSEGEDQEEAAQSKAEQLASEAISDALDGWKETYGATPTASAHVVFRVGAVTNIFRDDGRLAMAFKDRVMAKAVSKALKKSGRNNKVRRRQISDEDSEGADEGVEAEEIPMLIIYGRTSDECSRVMRATTMARQLLSSIDQPPSFVRRDFSNVKALKVVAEACSSSAHGAEDRLALKHLFKNVPRGSVILATNPDRLGRRPNDRQYVRAQAADAGIRIFVQGVPDEIQDSQRTSEILEDIEDAEDEDKLAEYERSLESKGRAQWRDYTGSDAVLIDNHLANSLIFAHEVGFYVSTTRYIDRLLDQDISDLNEAQQWLKAIVKSRAIKQILVLSRTSGLSKNSNRRQKSFCIHLVELAKATGVTVVTVELESVSTWQRSAAAVACDEDRFDDALIIGTSIDRFARTTDGWLQVHEVASRRRQTWIATIWPLSHLNSLLNSTQALPNSYQFSSGRLKTYNSFGSLKQGNVLPVLLPVEVAGAHASVAAATVLERMQAGESFIRGLRASHWQGSNALPIPESMIVERGISPKIGTEVLAVVKDNYLPTPSDTILSSVVCQPKGGSTRDLWVCRCKSDASLHTGGCRCGCTTCKALDEDVCPSKVTADGLCPPLCPCTCTSHHKTEKKGKGTARASAKATTSSKSLLSAPSATANAPSSKGPTSSKPSKKEKAEPLSPAKPARRKCTQCTGFVAPSRRGNICGGCANKKSKAKKEQGPPRPLCATPGCKNVAEHRPYLSEEGTPEVCKTCYNKSHAEGTAGKPKKKKK